MKKEEFTAKIQEIGQCEDEAARRTLLAELNQAAGEDYDSFATATATAESLRTENEDLRKANLRLFKMVGEDDDADPDDAGQDDSQKKGKDGKDEKKIEFADLFDENGNLK